MSKASLIQLLAEVGPDVAQAILSYVRGESDDRPPELVDLPDLEENEIAVARAKARARG